MRKIVVVIALVAFIGIYTAPAFASSESAKIVMAKLDDEPKKKKETKKDDNQNKDNKQTTDPKQCPHMKECKQECKETCQPATTCDEHKKIDEKK